MRILGFLPKIAGKSVGNVQYSDGGVIYPRILTDEIESNPIQPDAEFDFQEYSKAIVDIIKGSEPKFSIGIYGEWGSGKTTLMRLIQNGLQPRIFTWENVPDIDTENLNLKNYLREKFNIKGIERFETTKNKDRDVIILSGGKDSSHVSIDLNRSQTKATLHVDGRSIQEFLVQKGKEGLMVRENRVLTIWFNAWRYQSEDDFALIPLMKTIAYAMGEHPIYSALKPIILRGLAIIGKDILRYQASQFMTEKGIEEFEKNLTQKVQNSVEFDKELIYFNGMKKIEDEMSRILERYPDTRIVIFIDDLDRCSPDKALEIFESIKVFLDLKGIVFVMGLSREALDKLIVSKYEQLGLKGISGEQYIRKIIQIEIQISKWNDMSIKNLIKQLSATLDKKYAEQVSNNEELIQMVVEFNPRQAKRFINNFIVALSANKQLDSTKFLLIEALHKRWRVLYDNLSDPVFLKEIKKGMETPAGGREAYIATVEQQIAEDLKKGLTPTSLQTSLRDFRPYFLDEELWRFLDKFGAPIFEKISSEGAPVTEEETAVAKGLESLKKTRDSVNIPIPEPNAPPVPPKKDLTYASNYYQDLANNAEESVYGFSSLFNPPKPGTGEQQLSDRNEEIYSRNAIIDRFRQIKDRTLEWLIFYMKKREPISLSPINVTDEHVSIKTLCAQTLDKISEVQPFEPDASSFFKSIDEIKRKILELQAIARSALDELKVNYPGELEEPTKERKQRKETNY